MKQKLVMILMIIFVASLGFAGCQSKENEAEVNAVFVAGTYEGEAEGYAGLVKVAVTVNETVIEKVEILELNDSDFTSAPAEQMAENMVSENSSDVDTMAGATATTTALKEAVENALSTAYVDGVKPEGNAVTEEEEEEAVILEDRESEIVIIGAGGAGLTAAIEASMNGKKVIVVEKMSMVGGNTKLATGGLNAAETSSQDELGIEDTVETFVEDTMKGGGDINNRELVQILAEKSAETVDWLKEIGADLSDVGIMGGSTNNRTHRPTGGAAVGGHVMDVLHEKALELGVEIILNSEVVEILGDGVEVEGVSVKTAEGTYNISSKAVIVATGGFGANNDLVASFDPALKGYGTTNHPGATGDVTSFAKNFDLGYVDMEQIQTHPTVMPSNNYMITEAVRGNGAILVNREAERFVNELETRAVVSDAQLAQSGASSFLMFDQSVRESLSAIEGYYEKGFLVEGATLEELAEKLEMDKETLQMTFDTYNASVESGTDADFGREDMAASLSVGPFYAVEVAPAVHHTMGGVIITVNGEVVNADGEVITGLFAAGEVTGGIHGNNRLGGNAMADITIFGRIAAKSAVAFLE
ncbi:MAG TPA: flavocytochrome c [Proteiniclasticum sp.]|nr:flavocytochrome c [Proteiniclasticum sp.]